MAKTTTSEKPARRVTIMISDDLDAKVRNRQAKLIQADHKTHSYSSVINDAVRKGLR